MTNFGSCSPYSLEEKVAKRKRLKAMVTIFSFLTALEDYDESNMSSESQNYMQDKEKSMDLEKISLFFCTQYSSVDDTLYFFLTYISPFPCCYTGNFDITLYNRDNDSCKLRD